MTATADRSAELASTAKTKQRPARTKIARDVRASRSPAALHELTQIAIAINDIHAMDEAVRNGVIALPTLELLADVPHWRIVQGVANNTRTTPHLLDRIVGVRGDIAFPTLRDDENWKWVLLYAATSHALRPTTRRHITSLNVNLLDAGIASRTDLADDELRLFANRGAGSRIWVAHHLFRDPLRLPDVADQLREDRHDDVVNAAFGTFPNQPLLERWEFRRFLYGLAEQDARSAERTLIPEPMSPLTKRVMRLDRHTPDCEDPDVVLHEILLERDPVAARIFAGRFSATAEQLDTLADYPDPWVTQGVVGNLLTTEKTIRRVLGTAGDIDRPEIRQSGNWREVVRTACIHPRLDAIARRQIGAGDDSLARALIAARRDLSDAELAALCADDRPAVRAQAAYVLSTDPVRMPELLASLQADDPMPSVVEAAHGAAPQFPGIDHNPGPRFD